MVPGILGKKIGMTQVFDAQGRVAPVTVLQAGPCVVVQRKTREKDGYEAVQLGLVEFVKESRLTKPELGRLKKAGVDPVKYVRELRLDEHPDAELKTGDRVLAEEFKPKQRVDVIGTSKGKGFTGLVKRHNFLGGSDTHGSMSHRAPGSIGSSSYPSRVFRGLRMAGRHGGSQVTTIGLEIVEVHPEDNVILVRGAVPGPNGGYVVVRRSRK
jgi:large subunit ribosomal protein L3